MRDLYRPRWHRDVWDDIRKIKNLSLEKQKKVLKSLHEKIDNVEEVWEMLKSSPNKDISLESICNRFEISPKQVRDIIEELEKRGCSVMMKQDTVQFSKELKLSEPVIDVSGITEDEIIFGALGDNHLCSKYERLDILNSLYDEFERAGVKEVYNTGNWIDGEHRFNKHDLKVHGLDNQMNYMIENYPEKKGMTTFYVAGDDHEGWYTQREGIDVGKYLEFKAREAGREDLSYLGYMENDIIKKSEKGETTIRVSHPGGGSSYAISYSAQKIVESYQEYEKPDFLLIGHYHKVAYNYIRGVHCIQTATTCDQTPFMRKKKIAAHLGGWIIKAGRDAYGDIVWIEQRFIPFFNRKTYQKKWQYVWAP